MPVRTVFTSSLLFLFLLSTSVSSRENITKADIDQAKSEIGLLKQDIQIKEAELRLMELQLARQSVMPIMTAKPIGVSATTPQPKPVTQTIQLPLNSELAQAPKRTNVDPKPYEASVIQPVALFRTDGSAKWLVLDEERVVFWVVDDEAYLVNLAVTCAGLLDAKKLRLENFSSRVRAGHDGVLFNDQRCQIKSIEKLGGRSLPKPPRN